MFCFSLSNIEAFDTLEGSKYGSYKVKNVNYTQRDIYESIIIQDSLMPAIDQRPRDYLTLIHQRTFTNSTMTASEIKGSGEYFGLILKAKDSTFYTDITNNIFYVVPGGQFSYGHLVIDFEDSKFYGTIRANETKENTIMHSLNDTNHFRFTRSEVNGNIFNPGRMEVQFLSNSHFNGVISNHEKNAGADITFIDSSATGTISNIGNMDITFSGENSFSPRFFAFEGKIINTKFLTMTFKNGAIWKNFNSKNYDLHDPDSPNEAVSVTNINIEDNQWAGSIELAASSNHKNPNINFTRSTLNGNIYLDEGHVSISLIDHSKHLGSIVPRQKLGYLTLEVNNSEIRDIGGILGGNGSITARFDHSSVRRIYNKNELSTFSFENMQNQTLQSINTSGKITANFEQTAIGSINNNNPESTLVFANMADKTIHVVNFAGKITAPYRAFQETTIGDITNSHPHSSIDVTDIKSAQTITWNGEIQGNLNGKIKSLILNDKGKFTGEIKPLHGSVVNLTFNDGAFWQDFNFSKISLNANSTLNLTLNHNTWDQALPLHLYYPSSYSYIYTGNINLSLKSSQFNGDLGINDERTGSNYKHNDKSQLNVRFDNSQIGSLSEIKTILVNSPLDYSSDLLTLNAYDSKIYANFDIKGGKNTANFIRSSLNGNIMHSATEKTISSQFTFDGNNSDLGYAFIGNVTNNAVGSSFILDFKNGATWKNFHPTNLTLGENTSTFISFADEEVRNFVDMDFSGLKNFKLRFKDDKIIWNKDFVTPTTFLSQPKTYRVDFDKTLLYTHMAVKKFLTSYRPHTSLNFTDSSVKGSFQSGAYYARLNFNRSSFTGNLELLPIHDDGDEIDDINNRSKVDVTFDGNPKNLDFKENYAFKGTIINNQPKSYAYLNVTFKNGATWKDFSANSFDISTNATTNFSIVDNVWNDEIILKPEFEKINPIIHFVNSTMLQDITVYSGKASIEFKNSTMKNLSARHSAIIAGPHNSIIQLNAKNSDLDGIFDFSRGAINANLLNSSAKYIALYQAPSSLSITMEGKEMGRIALHNAKLTAQFRNSSVASIIAENNDRSTLSFSDMQGQSVGLISFEGKAFSADFDFTKTLDGKILKVGDIRLKNATKLTLKLKFGDEQLDGPVSIEGGNNQSSYSFENAGKISNINNLSDIIKQIATNKNIMLNNLAIQKLSFARTNLEIAENKTLSKGEGDEVFSNLNTIENLDLTFGNALIKKSEGQNIEIIPNSPDTQNPNSFFLLTQNNAHVDENPSYIQGKNSYVDIGKNNDNLEKHITFVFTPDTFTSVQSGYIGNIRGGTKKSSYEFFNAGHINISQLDGSVGTIALDGTILEGADSITNSKIYLKFKDSPEGVVGLYANLASETLREVKNISFDFTEVTSNDKIKNLDGDNNFYIAGGKGSNFNFINLKDSKQANDEIAWKNSQDDVFATLQNAGVHLRRANSSDAIGKRLSYNEDTGVNTIQTDTTITKGLDEEVFFNFYGSNISGDKENDNTIRSNHSLGFIFDNSSQNNNSQEKYSLYNSSQVDASLISSNKDINLVLSGKEAIKNAQTLNVEVGKGRKFNLVAYSANGFIGSVHLVNTTPLQAGSNLDIEFDLSFEGTFITEQDIKKPEKSKKAKRLEEGGNISVFFTDKSIDGQKGNKLGQSILGTKNGKLTVTIDNETSPILDPELASTLLIGEGISELFFNNAGVIKIKPSWDYATWNSLLANKFSSDSSIISKDTSIIGDIFTRTKEIEVKPDDLPKGTVIKSKVGVYYDLNFSSKSGSYFQGSHIGIGAFDRHMKRGQSVLNFDGRGSLKDNTRGDNFGKNVANIDALKDGSQLSQYDVNLTIVLDPKTDSYHTDRLKYHRIAQIRLNNTGGVLKLDNPNLDGIKKPQALKETPPGKLVWIGSLTPVYRADVVNFYSLYLKGVSLYGDKLYGGIYAQDKQLDSKNYQMIFAHGDNIFAKVKDSNEYYSLNDPNLGDDYIESSSYGVKNLANTLNDASSQENAIYTTFIGDKSHNFLQQLNDNSAQSFISNSSKTQIHFINASSATQNVNLSAFNPGDIYVGNQEEKEKNEMGEDVTINDGKIVSADIQGTIYLQGTQLTTNNSLFETSLTLYADFDTRDTGDIEDNNYVRIKSDTNHYVDVDIDGVLNNSALKLQKSSLKGELHLSPKTNSILLFKGANALDNSYDGTTYKGAKIIQGSAYSIVEIDGAQTYTPSGQQIENNFAFEAVKEFAGEVFVVNSTLTDDFNKAFTPQYPVALTMTFNEKTQLRNLSMEARNFIASKVPNVDISTAHTMNHKVGETQTKLTLNFIGKDSIGAVTTSPLEQGFNIAKTSNPNNIYNFIDFGEIQLDSFVQDFESLNHQAQFIPIGESYFKGYVPVATSSAVNFDTEVGQQSKTNIYQAKLGAQTIAFDFGGDPKKDGEYKMTGSIAEGAHSKDSRYVFSSLGQINAPTSGPANFVDVLNNTINPNNTQDFLDDPKKTNRSKPILIQNGVIAITNTSIEGDVALNNVTNPHVPTMNTNLAFDLYFTDGHNFAGSTSGDSTKDITIARGSVWNVQASSHMSSDMDTNKINKLHIDDNGKIALNSLLNVNDFHTNNSLVDLRGFMTPASTNNNVTALVGAATKINNTDEIKESFIPHSLSTHSLYANNTTFVFGAIKTPSGIQTDSLIIDEIKAPQENEEARNNQIVILSANTLDINQENRIPLITIENSTNLTDDYFLNPQTKYAGVYTIIPIIEKVQEDVLKNETDAPSEEEPPSSIDVSPVESFVGAALEEPTEKPIDENPKPISKEGKKVTYYLSGFLKHIDTPVVDSFVNALDTIYRAFRIETNNLNLRMSELRQNNAEQGVWARISNGLGSDSRDSDFYTTLQGGYDYKFKTNSAINYLGISLGENLISSKGSGYKSNGHAINLGIYNTYIMDNGLYVDALANYLHLSHNIDLTKLLHSNNNEISSHAFLFGAEIGYRMEFDKFFPLAQANIMTQGYFIEPQARLTYGFLGETQLQTTKDNENIIALLRSNNALISRAGTIVGKHFKTNSGLRIDLRLGLSYINELNTGGKIIVEQTSMGYKNKFSSLPDNKLDISLGTNIALKDTLRFYLNVSRSFLGEYNIDYNLNIGMRYSFGASSKVAHKVLHQSNPQSPRASQNQSNPINKVDEIDATSE